MNLFVDTSVVIAVIADEPEKPVLIAKTQGFELFAPHSLYGEIGNAFSAMLKRDRITLEQAIRAVEIYQKIPLNAKHLGESHHAANRCKHLSGHQRSKPLPLRFCSPAGQIRLSSYGGNMKKFFLSIAMTVALFTATVVSSTLVQNPPGASGHWEGSIEVPGTALEIVIDLTRSDKGQWKGVIAIPTQNLQDFPLNNLKVEGEKVSFEMTSVQGLPTFTGKLSADGKTIVGNLSQSGQTFPFKLERKGDAKISATETSAASIKVSADVEGSWQGTLDAGGTLLKLILKIGKAADGSFTASLDSPDQGSTDLPINALTATSDSLTFEMKYAGALYEGKFNKERTEVTGSWRQGGASLPLILKRAAKKSE